MSSKQIYLEPLWFKRREFDDLSLNPPAGYEFITMNDETSSIRHLSYFSLSYRLLNTAGRWLPVNLARARLLSRTPLPQHTSLVYAVSHPSFRKFPWILDLRAEQPYIMAGGERSFDNFRDIVCRLLKSKYCRSIIYECETGKRALRQSLNTPELATKIKVVPSGVPLRKFHKAFGSGKTVKLLFVNSANINAAWNFNLKGGQILLETFCLLKQEYPKLELFIRSGIPEKLKRSYSGIPGLSIVDKSLPWEELDREFKTTDIFVMPTYVTPSIVFLDAMSYELPIITTDVWANQEYIRDGNNGLVIHHPLAGSFTEGDIVHFNSPAFRKALYTVDRKMVIDLTAAVRLLIENVELRRKMGTAGRAWVEKEHSLDVWRNGLKKVLDEALEIQNNSL